MTRPADGSGPSAGAGCESRAITMGGGAIPVRPEADGAAGSSVWQQGGTGPLSVTVAGFEAGPLASMSPGQQGFAPMQHPARTGEAKSGTTIARATSTGRGRNRRFARAFPWNMAFKIPHFGPDASNLTDPG
jgi:hypothetical protein